MKKYIYLILLSFVIITCKAQSPVYDISEPHEGPKDSYYKDLNGDLDGYDGTYIFTDGTTTLKIALKKKVLSYGYYYQDLVVGELQFVKNGVEMINTIPNINYNYTDEEINHVLKGHLILTGTMWGCPDCSPTEKRLRLGFVDNVSVTVAGLDIRKTTVNGVPAIKVHIFSTGDVRMIRPDDPPPLPATIPLGKYLMTRVFYNNYLLKHYIKNDCPSGVQGSWVSYEVLAGKHTSTLSQADADQKALDDMNANGQANANAKGWCVFKNKAYTNIPFKKNNCVSPYVGTYVPYSLDAGWVTSNVSQADADEKAKQPGQANANKKGNCN